jgi:UDP-N-acetyl-D-glucosamine dehydrogenase
MSKVFIIGQGYVGLTVAKFAAAKYTVIGFDSNEKLIDQLNAGKSHIEGISDDDISTLRGTGAYTATANAADLADCKIVVIAVPTPLKKDRTPDLIHIESACKTIAQFATGPLLIINESTSYPGTVRNLIKPTIDSLSSKPFEHLYAISPERVDPGRTDWDQSNTPRLYSGLTKEAADKTKEFYSTFCNSLVEVSSPEVAEAAKLFENSFRQVNIALVNELAQISHALGISVRETLDAADTKPYGFMKFSPSAGVGGHCIPVDPSYLAHVAKGLGVPATFIERANLVNLEMPNYIIARVVKENGGSLKGKKVQVIGVSYKSNIADTRETPAEIMIESLKAAGAVVSWHDPLVKTWNGTDSAPLGDSDIAIVVTKHDLLSEDAIKASAPYVFDTTGKISGVPGL